VSRKEQIIEQMLWWYRDVVDPVAQGQGPRGADSGWLQMPEEYTEHFRELERALHRMRAEVPYHYRHVRKRYLASWRKTVDVRFVGGRAVLPSNTGLVGAGSADRKVGHKGETVERRLVEIWDVDVDGAVVRQGVTWLAEDYRGEPFLPRAMMRERSAA
jgi:hypothetical protein